MARKFIFFFFVTTLCSFNLYSEPQMIYTPAKFIKDLKKTELDIESKRERVTMLGKSALKLSPDDCIEILNFIKVCDNEELNTSLRYLIINKGVFDSLESLLSIEKEIRYFLDKYYVDNPEKFHAYLLLLSFVNDRKNNRFLAMESQLLYHYIVELGSEKLLIYNMTKKHMVEAICDHFVKIGNDYVCYPRIEGYEYLFNKFESGNREVKLILLNYAKHATLQFYFNKSVLDKIVAIYLGKDEELKSSAALLLKHVLHLKNNAVLDSLLENWKSFDLKIHLMAVIKDENLDKKKRKFAISQLAYSAAIHDNTGNDEFAVLKELVKENLDKEVKSSLYEDLIYVAYANQNNKIAGEVASLCVISKDIESFDNSTIGFICWYFEYLQDKLTKNDESRLSDRLYNELCRRIKNNTADGCIIMSFGSLCKTPKRSAKVILEFVKRKYKNENNIIKTIKSGYEPDVNEDKFFKAQDVKDTFSALKKLTGQDHGTDLATWEKAISEMPED